jgi:hypothetical protein
MWCCSVRFKAVSRTCQVSQPQLFTECTIWQVAVELHHGGRQVLQTFVVLDLRAVQRMQALLW